MFMEFGVTLEGIINDVKADPQITETETQKDAAFYGCFANKVGTSTINDLELPTDVEDQDDEAKHDMPFNYPSEYKSILDTSSNLLNECGMNSDGSFETIPDRSEMREMMDLIKNQKKMIIVMKNKMENIEKEIEVRQLMRQNSVK